MPANQKRVLIFDIDNNQESYASCLEFILELESGQPSLDLLRSFLEDGLCVTACLAPKRALIYLEQPIIVDGKQEEPGIKCNARPLTIRNLRDETLLRLKELAYHVRVHFDKNADTASASLPQFRYLALMLQRLEFLFKDRSESKKRLSIFLVPSTCSNYPFADTEGVVDHDTYNMASRFLRLLAKDYTGVIYGVPRSENVRVLNFEMRPLREPYFPLIPADSGSYGSLFHTPLSPEDLETLFSLRRKNSRFRKAAGEDPRASLRDYMIETAYYQIREMLRDIVGWERTLRDTFGDRYPSLLQFAFFAFMLPNGLSASDSGEARGMFRRILALAEDFSLGFEQIVQNAIQHSAHHKCVFTFGRMQESGDLEVFIADLNDRSTMTETFAERLRNECHARDTGIALPWMTEGYPELIDIINKGKASVSNFFNGFEGSDKEVIKAWYHFRKSISSSHIGLLLFTRTIQRCRATVQVVSSKAFRVSPSSCYTNSPADGTRALAKVIPGTQFVLRIPSSTIKEGPAVLSSAQLSNHQSFREDYDAFARYIDYQVQPLRCKERFEENLQKTAHLVLTDADGKFQALRCWTTFWCEELQADPIKKSVFCLDAQGEACIEQTLRRDNQGLAEVFIKGLLNAAGLLPQGGHVFLAMVNLSDSLISQIKDILFSRAMLMHFPENLQLYFSGERPEGESTHRMQFTLLGSSMVQALENARILSLEQGNNAITRDDISDTIWMLKEFEGVMEKTGTGRPLPAVMPFDALLACPENPYISLFDARIMQISNAPIDRNPYGYLLKPTHMRLGNKVHIQSFYEMSFLFYRTSIANRAAFEILRAIRRATPDLLDSNVMFYGYASYSKAILTSLVEITKAYLLDYAERPLKGTRAEKQLAADRRVSFASYQYNLQTESSAERIQMYFGISKELGEVTSENKLELKGEARLRVVQIVPISSTMTTFEKMWKHFTRYAPPEAQLHSNYTVYWVHDKDKGDNHSDIESIYWRSHDPANRKITTRLELENRQKARLRMRFKPDLRVGRKTQPRPELKIGRYNRLKVVHYFMRSGTVWRDTWRCEMCFPDESKILDEVPLVVTDPSSTVPTQQIRTERQMKADGLTRQEREKQKQEQRKARTANNERLLKLKDSVYYGHIERSKAHQQFYIDTQRLFYEAKNEVRDWLEDLKSEEDRLENEKNNDTSDRHTPLLRIIFSPEHNTNVGFSQYVNTYYFGGTAEIISINEDKEYRSNFICEHSGLIATIQQLCKEHETGELPVEFYFSDDNINTGETFHKACNLLRSLLPGTNCPTYIFKKCFFLIERLSMETKGSYVPNPQENFLSFLHIDISNMRRQGDSCVGCSLEQDANDLYERGATKKLTAYWRQKREDFSRVLFDDREKMRRFEKLAFKRLVLSHVAQNVLVHDNDCFPPGKSYDAILKLMYTLLGIRGARHSLDETCFNYDRLRDDIAPDNDAAFECMGLQIKLLSRPFFSFEFKFRTQMLTFLLVLAETLLSEKSGQTAILAEIEHKFSREEREYNLKSFLAENNRIANTVTLALRIRAHLANKPQEWLDFLKDCVLESLFDIKSTYPLRKETLRKVLNHTLSLEGLEDETLHRFWHDYAANVHRSINCSNDETRALWLEYLLIAGEEYPRECDDPQPLAPCFLYGAVSSGAGANKAHASLCAFEHFCNEIFLLNTKLLFEAIEKRKEKDHFFMRRWKEFRSWDMCWMPKEAPSTDSPLKEEQILFDGLAGAANTKERYPALLSNAAAMINSKYGIKERNIRIALLTQRDPDMGKEGIEIICLHPKDNGFANTQKLFASKYQFKQQLQDALPGNPPKTTPLTELGYTLETSSENDIETTHIILAFSHEVLAKMAPVYLIIEIDCLDESTHLFTSWMIMRDLLCHRNRLMRLFEEDFSSDTLGDYAHIVNEKHILQHERAFSHASTIDDLLSLHIWPDANPCNKEILLEEPPFGDEESCEFIRLKDTGMIAEWIALRNYVNGQIAKLFNRSFDVTGDALWYNDSVPKLYPAELPQVAKEAVVPNRFQQTLQKFEDLALDTDGRFVMLRQVAHIHGTDRFANASFVSQKEKNGQDTFFSAEYFRCILLDIILTSIKFCSPAKDYLSRIDGLLDRKGQLTYYTNKEKKWPRWPDAWDDTDRQRHLDYLKKRQCHVFLYNRGDRLVILNLVNPIVNNVLSDWKSHNDAIKQRLEDPLDSAAGKLSLLTFYRYIGKRCKERPSFEYRAITELKDNEMEDDLLRLGLAAANSREDQLEELSRRYLVFETSLPVLNDKRESGAAL